MSERMTASPCARGLCRSLLNFALRDTWTERNARTFFPWRAAYKVKDTQVNCKKNQNEVFSFHIFFLPFWRKESELSRNTEEKHFVFSSSCSGTAPTCYATLNSLQQVHQKELQYSSPSLYFISLVSLSYYYFAI